MKALLLSESIKQRRMELGLTVGELCEGICDPTTLYRMETGKVTPTHNRVKALLQRLNMPDDRYYALLNEHDLELANVRKELLSCCSRFERAGTGQKRQAWKLAMEQVRRLEELMEEDDTITRQFLLSHRATLGTVDEPYSLEQRLNLLLEALRLTVPKFNMKDIGSRRYSVDEIRLINQIAGTYSRAGEHTKALELYSQLFDYVRKCSDCLSNFPVHFTLVTYNYARELALCQYYHKSIEVAEDGRQASVNYGYYQFLPGFLTILGESYYIIGEEEKSKKFYVRAHYLYDVLGDEYSLHIVDSDIRNRFHIEFSI